MPLMLTHGWPGSVRRVHRGHRAAADPTRRRRADAVPLVIPSLPGFGFSGKPAETGWGVERIARAWAELMRRLGYTRWVAQGGDWGAAVTTAIGAQAPEGCAGIHVNMPVARPLPEDMAAPGADELRALKALRILPGPTIRVIRSSRAPARRAIGYGLVDSPVGLAGWIFEKMYAWTDKGDVDGSGSPFDALGRDAILDNIMLYWLPATGASSARLYWESFASFGEGTGGDPVGGEPVPAARSSPPRASGPSGATPTSSTGTSLPRAGISPRGSSPSCSWANCARRLRRWSSRRSP